MDSIEKSSWGCIYDKLKEPEPVRLGRHLSYWWDRTPRRILYSMSYYKFAAKMIGSEKRVLDVGCNEGMGSYLLAKECGYVQGMDCDAEAICVAQQNFGGEQSEFICADFLDRVEGVRFDAVTSFDMVEHIPTDCVDLFFSQIVRALNAEGMAVIGTAAHISQQCASGISKREPISPYDDKGLENVLLKHFEHVFLFAANDEVVHAGFSPFAAYYIAVACGPKCHTQVS